MREWQRPFAIGTTRLGSTSNTTAVRSLQCRADLPPRLTACHRSTFSVTTRVRSIASTTRREGHHLTLIVGTTIRPHRPVMLMVRLHHNPTSRWEAMTKIRPNRGRLKLTRFNHLKPGLNMRFKLAAPKTFPLTEQSETMLFRKFVDVEGMRLI